MWLAVATVVVALTVAVTMGRERMMAVVVVGGHTRLCGSKTRAKGGGGGRMGSIRNDEWAALETLNGQH